MWKWLVSEIVFSEFSCDVMLKTYENKKHFEVSSQYEGKKVFFNWGDTFSKNYFISSINEKVFAALGLLIQIKFSWKKGCKSVFYM